MPSDVSVSVTHQDDDETRSASSPQVRVDGAHDKPISTPAPYAWQDLNLSSEKIEVEVRLGNRGLTLRELELLKSGQVIRLETLLDEPVELLMDREVMAYGRIVIVDSRMAIQITELRQSPRRRPA